MPANAMEICDPEVLRKIDRLLDRKYGLMKKLFSLGAARQSRQDTILAIQLIE
jgi:hypothetical protein